ncbi:hypothetical protein N658DRAFT_526594 [Parathielavia hyrcaniae]|uniref:Uncharacterized protein n=1 Tax=Parathielavia hyrcaniae TaxID=113614 RepID=A0AAN6PZB5_9PEZI|nr:hypothetical protein N658DRAFT_526594 [Parathielavia hyrcaniae]
MASLASLSAPYQSGSNWFSVNKDGISFPPARSGKGTKGPRSLMATCIRLLADNVDAAPTTSIRCLPSKVKWALWRELHPRSMPLHTWQRLVPILLEDAHSTASGLEGTDQGVTVHMAVYRYCQEIFNPPCPLAIYTTPLQRLGDCLVRLCIDNVDRYQTHELIPLAHIPRLAVLELVEHDEDSRVISDRLVRGWWEAGKKQPAFPSLRVLQIASDNTCALSADALHSILKFPALEILDAFFNKKRRRDAKDIASSYGWKVTKPNTLGTLFVAYAEPYLDGQVTVAMTDFWRLREAFGDDTHRVRLVVDPGTEKQPPEGVEQADSSDPSSDLDNGWRALLRGAHPWVTTNVAAEDLAGKCPQSMTEDQAFWLLGLLAQKEQEAASRTRAQVEGITLPREPFVSLKLRDPWQPGSMEIGRWLHERLIFSRRRACPAPPKKGPDREPQRSRTPRRDDRKAAEGKPRKRQKTAADLLSSLEIPSGTSE